MQMFPTTWVDYFAFNHDGTSEMHTCQATTANRMSKEPQVRFAALLGRIDGVPCIVETLRGSEGDGVAIQAAKDAAQEAFGSI